MNKKEIQELVEKLTRTGVPSSVFNDAIHGIFSDMACDINKCGIADQIEFLVGQGYTRDQILKM